MGYGRGVWSELLVSGGLEGCKRKAETWDARARRRICFALKAGA
jgi:hypothetical protein